MQDTRHSFNSPNLWPFWLKLVRACRSTNNDLYYELFRTLFKKQLELEISWIPSHLKDPNTKKARPEWVRDVDIFGNSQADQFAGEAAKDYEVRNQTASDCIYFYKLVNAIQWRLIIIHQNLPDRAKYRTVRTQRKKKLRCKSDVKNLLTNL